MTGREPRRVRPWSVLLVGPPAGRARALERILSPERFRVLACDDGEAALARLPRSPPDAVVVGPGLDDPVGLCHRLREGTRSSPVVVVWTTLAPGAERSRALACEADEILLEPASTRVAAATLENALKRRAQPAPRLSAAERAPARGMGEAPPFPAVALAASTGGPEALSTVLAALPSRLPAAFLVVQHGPQWMLELLACRLERDCRLAVGLAHAGDSVEPGRVWLAPGDRHLAVEGSPPVVALADDPPENFLRPAADPLFRSLAERFRQRSVAVVLSGMGRDGALGAARVAASGGTVLVQDPETALAPSMPQTLVSTGLADEVLPLSEIGGRIARVVERLAGAGDGGAS